jgi:hypothetical protein
VRVETRIHRHPSNRVTHRLASIRLHRVNIRRLPGSTRRRTWIRQRPSAVTR